MTDLFQKFPSNIDSPAANAFIITANDSSDLALSTRSLYVGSGGNVEVELVDSETVVIFTNVPDAAILPIRVRKLYSSNTTASDFIGLI